MLKNDEIADILRQGVRQIISRSTPPCCQELSGNYHRSSHPSREILFAIAGESQYLCNDSVYPCTPGTLFLIDSGVPHGHRYVLSDNGLLHLWGYFYNRSMHLSFIEVTVNGQHHVPSGMSSIYMPEGIMLQIEERWNLLSQHSAVTPEIMDHYMKAPINAALDEVAFQLCEHRPRPRHEQTRIEDLKEYILSRNGRECSLERLAAVSGYTRGYIAHKFRDTVGVTVGEYIDNVRLQYIRNARKHGVRQKEMAYELGFSSPAAFWNWFRKYRDDIKLTGE